ncbi:MAG: 50S ribosomal protein L24e [Candidatus Micrarchaeaceae archaeon]
MKCTYCSTEIKKGTGTMYIYKTGAISYFCSNRCFKNVVKMKRKINRKELKQKRK